MQELIILGFGRFGRALTDLATGSGLSVRVYDPFVGAAPIEAAGAQACADLEAALGTGGPVLTATPMATFAELLTELRPHLQASHTVIDVSSVKGPAVAEMGSRLGNDIPWIASHPLYGPASIALGEHPLRVILCPDTPHQAAVHTARQLFERLGCTVDEQPSDEHDRLMADTHALAFFVAKAMLAIGASEGEVRVPPSFRSMAATIESVRADAGHLFYPIQHDNPHAPAARERLLDALGRIHRELADSSPENAAANARQDFEIPPPKSTPIDLHVTRERIDVLDQEIMELLERRSQLSLRAMRAKRLAGRQVQDPARERDLLERRRRLASDKGLDPEAISAVFEAILRFSRGEQHRWIDGLGD